MEAMLTAFLMFTLSQWNARCEVLHGVDEEETRARKKSEVVDKVRVSYNSKDKVTETYTYLFDGILTNIVNDQHSIY